MDSRGQTGLGLLVSAGIAVLATFVVLGLGANVAETLRDDGSFLGSLYNAPNLTLLNVTNGTVNQLNNTYISSLIAYAWKSANGTTNSTQTLATNEYELNTRLGRWTLTNTSVFTRFPEYSNASTNVTLDYSSQNTTTAHDIAANTTKGLGEASKYGGTVGLVLVAVILVGFVLSAFGWAWKGG